MKRASSIGIALAIAAVVATMSAIVSAQAPAAIDESFFSDKLYPLLHAAQCVRCHSDNGVGSETRLEFPPAEASKEQLAVFGLSVLELIDRKNPDESLLLQKPTRRIKHTGGQRIKPGSDEERTLLTWI